MGQERIQHWAEVPLPDAGTYSIVIEGCDTGLGGSTCRQGWTVPVTITYVPMAGGPGFEPGLTESESAVLPLNYPPPDGTRSSTPTNRRDVRYRASGFVRWRIPEMPPAATDGRLRLQRGPRKATKSPQTRIPSGAAARG